MAVRRQPITQKEKEYIDNVIFKGSHTINDIKEKHKKEWVNVNLRISSEMVSNVDEALKSRVGITRTGWILEAIHEKLLRLDVKD